MAAPRKIDYESIEPGWRAGIKSPQQLAIEYHERTGVSVSRAAIMKYFKSRNIPRDLKAKVIAKADEMVTRAMVAATMTPETIQRDEDIVSSAAKVVADIRIGQRKDIGKTRALATKLLEELEVVTDNGDLLEQIEKIAAGDDDSGKAQALFARMTSLPQRIKSIKELADTLRVLVMLEAEAWGFASVPEETPPPERIDPLEGARRIAFALHRAGQAQSTVH